jgi:putative transcriptional regulator
VDWKKLRRTVNEEIHRQIAENPDTAPEVSDFSGFRKVYNPPLPDVKAVRCKLKLSQEAFASRFGFSTRSVQRWEEG